MSCGLVFSMIVGWLGIRARRREVEQRKQGAKAGRKDSDEGQKKQLTKTTIKDSEEAAGAGDKNEVDREQELAATKIQSRMRGKQARLGGNEPVIQETLHPSCGT